jgi:hypothetical protein
MNYENHPEFDLSDEALQEIERINAQLDRLDQREQELLDQLNEIVQREELSA